ncbi:hypothetical protein PBI_DEWDROP_51 [Microbacterium phage Dewdrop]|nr:hypothetical protein PBI_LEAF_51 [Microbacterium phage Leaf]QGZ17420.1 hypothetical protein PBI_DEWDROP_51 [Microbacterium phage Dewdrop]
MMRVLLAFLGGIGVAWAALAIWQHRAIPDIDPADVPPVDEIDQIVYHGRSIWDRDTPQRSAFEPDCTGFRNPASARQRDYDGNGWRG